jgi:ADP-heptose:LPS heptosyltransferase
MRLALVRAVDRHIGIPACLLATLLFRLFPRRGRALPPAEPRRVLVILLSEMGSAILASPALDYLKGRWPGAEIHALVFSKNRAGFDLPGIIPPGRVHGIRPDGARAFLVSTLAALRLVRALQIDTVLDFELFSRYSALLSAFSGAARRVGFHPHTTRGLYRGDMMTHPVLYNPHRHISVNFLALVKALERGTERPLVKEAVALPLALPRILPEAETAASLLAKIEAAAPGAKSAEWVALAPSAGPLLPIRAWPLENYVELGRRVLERPGTALVVLGGEDARPHARRLLEALGSARCADLAGKTSPKEVLAVLSRCRALVCQDSGMAHIAALARCPSVVLFGPETPALYAPLWEGAVCLSAGFACSPCLSAANHRETPCRDAACMRALGVEEVWGRVEGIFKG